ncbi:fasciclin domain-containing protein [Prolixibacteraceae bacterium Z1-6]|uniref:Fasciclin domain-containing protein n=1 Tax=Draconibacterium aestuarii TaxID=2998507 RepID=A0A9X3J6A8_9BACT|nr:fasciclin domain-containing protein [Prolixibacteraceae bacterium Z1-6]
MKTVNLKKKVNLRSFIIVAVLLLSTAFVSCEKENDDYIPSTTNEVETKSAKALKKSGNTITEVAISLATAAENAEFTQLVAALSYVSEYYEDENGMGLDLVSFFDETDQYTVFAPTDEAFQALYGNEALESLLGYPVTGIMDIPVGIVKDVLLYHVTDGRRAANSMVPKNNIRTIETLLGASFSVDNNGKIWAIGNEATITAGNAVSASNGIIHIIDNVILPIEL